MGSIKFCYLDIQQDSCSSQFEQENDKIESSSFYLQYHINLLLQFPPHQHLLNFLSVKEQLYMDRSCLTDETLVRNFLSSKLISLSVPIKTEDIDSMIKTVTSTAKLLDEKATNAARKVIPLVMSVRLVFEQEYNAAINQRWRSALGKPLATIFNRPTIKSVTLDKAVFNKGLSCFMEECPICCQEFSDAEEITRLPCLHTYHGNCITEWLQESCFCPICRFALPVCNVLEILYPFKTKRVLQLQGSTRRSPHMSINYRDQFRLNLSLRECGI